MGGRPCLPTGDLFANLTRMWRRWLGVAVLLTGCSSTSSSSTTVEPCEPGEVITCRAPSGCSGEKVCNDDGKGYGSCLCVDGGAGSGGAGGVAASGGAGGAGTGGATSGGSGGATSGGSGGGSASGGTGGVSASGGAGGVAASGGGGGSATGGMGGSTTCANNTDCPATKPHCCINGVCRTCCSDSDCPESTNLCDRYVCDTAAGTCALTPPCGTDMLCCAIGTSYQCCPTDKTCCAAGCC
jgi:hypothetical protein